MIFQVRQNTFETNSSSTHSLCIASPEEFKKWKDGELFYSIYDEEFYTRKEVEEQIQKDIEHYIEVKNRLKAQNQKISHWVEQGCCPVDIQKVLADDEEEIEKFVYHSSILPYNVFFSYHNNLETFLREYTTEDGENSFVVFGCAGYDG